MIIFKAKRKTWYDVAVHTNSRGSYNVVSFEHKNVMAVQALKAQPPSRQPERPFQVENLEDAPL